MPAEREMGFRTERFNSAVAVSRRVRVSDIVEGGEWERRRTRASMAATGIVKSGSDWRRE